MSVSQIKKDQDNSKETKTFKLEPHLLRACAPAMSTDETRYYLNGVHVFESDGKMIYEATNGHILIRVESVNEQEDENIEGIDIIIPDFFVKEISKPKFLKGFGCIGLEWVDAVIDCQTINIEMPNGVVSNKLIDGTFPETDKVIPKKGSCRDLTFDSIGLNLGYLSKIDKSIKAMGMTVAETVFGNDNKSAVRFDAYSPEKGRWTALQMPARVN